MAHVPKNKHLSTVHPLLSIIDDMRGQTGVNPSFLAVVLSEEVKEENEETKKNKNKTENG